MTLQSLFTIFTAASLEAIMWWFVRIREEEEKKKYSSFSPDSQWNLLWLLKDKLSKWSKQQGLPHNIFLTNDHCCFSSNLIVAFGKQLMQSQKSGLHVEFYLES
ncbi:hypothetical protein ILYODFUR_018252 [Ilyodon furcidens]|uniref:Uncharacterized protein n=1 Tax=Ilyodon furcidens TaxID=33524 RepID=A0ABV0V6C1_9TELE